MNIDFGKIINDKLEAMKAERVIENKIEEVIEKTILDVVTSALAGYSLKRELENQIEGSIHEIAGDIGLSAYNGFIAEKVREIVSQEYEKDLVDKISNCLLKKHENVKLSDIFKRYREWLFDTIDYAEKYKYRRYCAELDVNKDGCFKTYKINLSEKELDYGEKPQIMIKILVYGNKEADNISSVCIDNCWLDSTLRIGTLTEFEAFILNLYYNRTEIILDVDEVDDDNYYDVDC